LVGGLLQIFPVGLGTWPFGGGYDWGPVSETDVLDTVHSALDGGYNFIDTAPLYGDGESERLLGIALRAHRKQVFLATKCGLIKKGSWPVHDLSPASVRKQAEESLRRLQTDFIDLYQIHYPDPHVPLADTLEVLMQLKAEGKIGRIGVCNFSAEQLRQAVTLMPIDAVQGHLSLVQPQVTKELLPLCRQFKIPFIGYGTLEGGILSGKYQRLAHAPNFRRADARSYFYKCYRAERFEQARAIAARVEKIAAEHACSPVAVAGAWALAQAGVKVVLCGARTAQQAAANKDAASVQLSARDITFLEGA